MKPSVLKILVITGSSGGHIFPAIAFLEALEQKNPGLNAFLILPQRNIINPALNPGYKIKYIKPCVINKSISRGNVRNVLNFISGSLESLVLLLKFQPDIVVGFGGLSSVPVVIAAWFLRAKTLIHEQNVMPGRANRFLSAFVDKIAVSFKETLDFLPRYKRKIVFTGNPLRKEVIPLDKVKAADFFGFSPDKFTILVMGGSQGSKRINFEFLKAVSSLEDKSKIQVIHLSGRTDYPLLQETYKDLGIKFALFSFFDSIEYAYSLSDLVLSRAGATAIAEIIFFKLPAVFVPYPYACGHQLKNAKVLEEKGCSIIIEDKELNSRNLKCILEDFLNNPHKLEKMRAGYEESREPDAGGLLAKELERTLRE